MPGKRNTVVHEILDSILEGTDLLLEWIENPHEQRRRLMGTLSQYEWDKIAKDRRKKSALQRMKKRKWIEDRRLGNRVEFELSNEAIIEYLQDHIRGQPSRIGSQETLVVFDIPESARGARKSWRRLLKKLGFRKLQLSVWSSAKDIGDQILVLIRALGIDEWVKVYSGTHLT